MSAYASVANAAAVSLAKVRGSVDTIFLPILRRWKLVCCRREKARKAAMEVGAIPDTVRIIEL
ncbi:hypothetical protein [Candidatus Williamhamiltonella defendens]|uniref:hypothetical protein n=1 Tax=Candidatus Williamhamiltonella defendens TaxID=138072 RepID=UPI001F451186|nr:hypothetical protein [Candidatus Hamiltonella defensa]